MPRKSSLEEVLPAENRKNQPEELETFSSAKEEVEAKLATEGVKPSYDNMLDLALEYTFPCSDPPAIQSCCTRIEARTRMRSQTD